MKQFHCETDLGAALEAERIVEVAWRVLQLVKEETARRQTTGLTLTQMRALGFLVASPGASLSEVAEDLGLQKPTTSKVVEELAQQGRLIRSVVPGNRRKVALQITPAGMESLEKAVVPAMTRVAELLGRLSPGGRETVAQAMTLLHPLVQPNSEKGSEGGHL